MSSSSSSSKACDQGEPSHQNAVAASTFPRFSSLPPELRLQIWRYFAPIDRRRAPHVLAFELSLPPGRKQSIVEPCPSLATQTAAIRAVLAVNRESRTEARKAYPHTMTLRDGTLVVSFNRDLDVVLVDTVDPEGQLLAGWEEGVRGFTDQVRQLAVGPRYFNQFRLFNMHPGWLLGFLAPFGRLSVAYYALTACVLDDAECSWCVSDKVNSFYRSETTDKGKRPYRLEAMYCWPNLLVGSSRQYAQEEKSFRKGEYAKSQTLDDLMDMIQQPVRPDDAAIPIIFYKGAYSCVSYEQLRRLRKVEYWPMVAFSGISCIRRYRALGGVDVGRYPDDSDTD
ncbi:hypothetical protein PG984_015236 [Apiospora sp. TS-2023a]